MFGDQTGGLAAQKDKHEVAAYTRIPSALPDRAQAGKVLSDCRVAMRDGVHLATDVYLPQGEGPFPTILTRMPYGKTEPYCYMPVIADHWVRQGYAAVVQDVRGKWASEGKFEPNLAANEVPDGYDTIDWIAQQDWSNGKVGMLGESYFGFTSYAGAVSGHPALVCAAPGDISLDRYRATMRYGCLQLNTVGTWAISMTDQTYQDLSRLDYWHLPMKEMANAAGAPSSYFDELMANPLPSRFWEEHSLLEGYESITIPILHWGGWYDNYLGPTIADWRVMAERNAARGNQHLFIGPGDHENTPDLLGRAGLMPVVGGTAEMRWDSYVAFFDRYLMGLDNGYGNEGSIRFFTLGRDLWRDTQSWPPAGTTMTPIYLHSGGKANTRHGNGRLAWDAPQEARSADSFDYDPTDPIAETLAIDCWSLAGQMGDRQTIEDRSDVLVYTTEPLAEGLELTGPITAKLYFATSAKDTDVTVSLVDVAQDGSANLIQDGILRCRYREGLDRACLMEPGTVYDLEIDVWSTSYLLKPGHRLRVEISSSNFNRYDRNLNTGEAFGDGAEPVVATQTLFHDAERPSHILLPVHEG
jgi:putative CocE/NonD family hydrolase